jgi:hypothetical protein
MSRNLVKFFSFSFIGYNQVQSYDYHKNGADWGDSYASCNATN